MIYYVGLAIMVLFSIWGYNKGFIKMLGGLLASVAAFLFLLYLRGWAFESALENLMANDSVLLARIVVSIGAYLLLAIILKIVLAAFGVVNKIPFLRAVNRFLGFLLGAVCGIVVVGAVYMFYQWINGIN